MEKKKVLFISQEIFPFSPKSDTSSTARRLPQVVQEAGKEIRVFTPRFGAINERRHQLHEVIRLSGLNICIDDHDHPLIIKVASVSSARMQVYFIDNDEYFKRKTTLQDENGKFYTDNDERAMFFCRGVLETVKKLGWQPDVIHCHGWMTGIMSLYIKHIYNKDPHFKDTKVVYSLYNDAFDVSWDKRFAEKLKFDGFPDEVAKKFEDTSFLNVTKSFIDYCDGLSIAVDNINPDLRAIFDSAVHCHKLDYVQEENQAKEFSVFFDKVVDESVLA
ncbi:MAG: glycogen/starch synthase [Bacteroidota bacterium]